MKIQPMSSPSQVPQPQSNTGDAKSRAVAAFMKGAQSPVLDQNAISPEELGAIKPKEEEVQDVEMRQNSTNEETVAEDSAPVESAKPEPKAEDPALSRQFAQLARQEKAIRAKAQSQEQAFRAREAALAAKEAAIAAKDQEYKTNYIPKNRLKEDAFSVLAEAGISYDEITQQAMNQQPANPRYEAHIARLEAKLAALEEANQTSQKTYQEQQQAQYDQAVKQIQVDAKHLVYTDPAFETIKAANAVKDVVELITDTYNKDGILLTVEEAAQQVEDYLVEEYMKVTKIDKIQKRLQANAKPAVQPKPQTAQAPKQTQPMKTLTNATGSTRQLSSRERAVLAFKGELK